MARNPEATRVVQLTAGLVSSGTAVTAAEEVDYPGNAFLLVNVLAAGTTNSVKLSTGTVSGAAGNPVSIGGAAVLSGLPAGMTAYHLNDKLSKYVYANVSGTGTPTIGLQLLLQGYANSSEVATSANVINPTEG